MSLTIAKNNFSVVLSIWNKTIWHAIMFSGLDLRVRIKIRYRFMLCVSSTRIYNVCVHPPWDQESMYKKFLSGKKGERAWDDVLVVQYLDEWDTVLHSIVSANHLLKFIQFCTQLTPNCRPPLNSPFKLSFSMILRIVMFLKPILKSYISKHIFSTITVCNQLAYLQ